jgi:hypothetical protein
VRSVIPILLALACPIGMCLVPMLLMRRRGGQASCHQPAAETAPSELVRLRREVAHLRAEKAPTEDAIR